MKSSSPFKHCFNPKAIISIGAVLLLLYLFTPAKAYAAGLAPFLLLLICPLSMLLMMKGMGGGKKCETQPSPQSSSPTALSTCPECGLSYREREWAEKCEVWCRQHHACNLEITRHAVNKATI